MTTVANLMGSGISGLAANAIATGFLSNSLTATGSTKADAYAITKDFSRFTTAGSGTGAILPTKCTVGDQYVVANMGASTMALYPPSGGTINSGSTDAALSIGAKKTALVICVDALTFVAILSA